MKTLLGASTSLQFFFVLVGFMQQALYVFQASTIHSISSSRSYALTDEFTNNIAGPFPFVRLLICLQLHYRFMFWLQCSQCSGFLVLPCFALMLFSGVLSSQVQLVHISWQIHQLHLWFYLVELVLDNLVESVLLLGLPVLEFGLISLVQFMLVFLLQLYWFFLWLGLCNINAGLVCSSIPITLVILLFIQVLVYGLGYPLFPHQYTFRLSKKKKKNWCIIISIFINLLFFF